MLDAIRNFVIWSIVGLLALFAHVVVFEAVSPLLATIEPYGRVVTCKILGEAPEDSGVVVWQTDRCGLLHHPGSLIDRIFRPGLRTLEVGRTYRLQVGDAVGPEPDSWRTDILIVEGEAR